MHTLNRISRRARLVGAAALLLSTSACSFNQVDPVPDPNSANVNPDNIIPNPSPGQVSALATGVEASLRLGHSGRGQYNALTGTFGREVYILALNDNRYYTELLGTNKNLDPAGPYNDVYTGFSRARHAAIVFRGSAETAAEAVLTSAQKQGVRGYTHTVEALAMLHLANLQYENGIRLDVNDIYKPSKFTESYQGVLTAINTLLTTAATELAAGGSSFGFPLPSGYSGFNTPANYLKFNRALAARVNLYRKDYTAAQAALAASFYDPTESLTVGPKMVFNAGAANDIGNPYAQNLNSNVSTLVTAQKDFVAQAEVGDARLAKVSARTAPRTLGGLTGSFDPNLFLQSSPLDLIRNEELILIAAEINIEKATPDFAAAVTQLNLIRSKAGSLPAYAGASTKAALEDELLKQRRYSLFYEGHRWVDMRRFDRLAQLPLDLPTHKVFDRMERPIAEVQYDQANP
jgi:starch-binding outer membrane protein, SusD/RagB family